MPEITPPDIAQAMRAMGWPVASALMKRWADSTAWTMPESVKLNTSEEKSLAASRVDETTVTMNWLLKFARAKDAHDAVVGKALNDNAKKLLKERLKNAGWSDGEFSLGKSSMSARALDQLCQTNFQSFGSLNDTIDELYGAIGKASLKVAVVGKVAMIEKKKFVFNVEKLGVYLRDTYEFNDEGWISQPLGVWSKKRCLSKAETAAYYAERGARTSQPALRVLPAIYADFEPVSNGDFTDWRSKSGRGGDFVIYSDVSWVDSPVKQVSL
jgi:hypothetical protein